MPEYDFVRQLQNLMRRAVCLSISSSPQDRPRAHRAPNTWAELVKGLAVNTQVLGSAG